jgi:hypothetical protein
MKGLRKKQETLGQTVSGMWFESPEYEAVMISTEHQSPAATNSTSVTGKRADSSLSSWSQARFMDRNSMVSYSSNKGEKTMPTAQAVSCQLPTVVAQVHCQIMWDW